MIKHYFPHRNYVYILYAKLKRLQRLKFVYQVYMYMYNTHTYIYISIIYTQNLYQSLSKCGIHFVYILYTFCEFWSTNSDHKNYVHNLYTKIIQNVYSLSSKCTPHLNNPDTLLVLFLATHFTQFKQFKFVTCLTSKHVKSIN